MAGLIQLRRKKKKGNATYSLTKFDQKRLVHFRCSGMHCKAVQDILEEVCVYDRCRWWCNVLNQFSGLEFVTPAFTVGIPEQLERLTTAISEIAIYAALFLTLFGAGFMNGFGPANSHFMNLRITFKLGFMVGITCFIVNIITSIIFRLSSAVLARESDMLVFISKTRYWHMINIAVFIVGTFMSLVSTLAAAEDFVFNGDHCLVQATGGSLAFMTWWLEWALNVFPRGAGAFYTKGEPIKNPWALKADALNLKRPSVLIGGRNAQAMFNKLNPQDKESFETYKEFMHGHFNLTGFDCFGYDESLSLISLIFVLMGPLIFFFFMRNSRVYWLLGAVLCGNDDPYDMVHVFKDFKERAKTGARLASLDGALRGKKDGFIDVNTEVSDDSDDEDGGPDQDECGGGGSGYNSAINHMTFVSDGLPVPPKPYTNNEQGTTPAGGRGGGGTQYECTIGNA
jgi:hypothetical protein